MKPRKRLDIERVLRRVLRRARARPGLRRLGPRAEWLVEGTLISATKMTLLNGKYRGKRRPTDVLSFPAPHAFRQMGHLGELVICREVLVRQAREQGHSAERELEVLVVHGVLHLLGMDHERGAREAARQRRWEGVLLARGGLIGR